MKRIRHRGPDWSGCVVSSNNIFCHERLAIVGVDSGAQPIVSADKSLILTVNGEIYNYKQLKSKYLESYEFVTYSDCEVIMHMYREFGADFLHHLDGIFSFVLFDVTNNLFVVARDAIGVTTLYYGFNSSSPSTFYVASEMKCLNDICDTIISFPPGHIFDSVNGFRQWYQPIWFNQKWFPKEAADYGLIRKKLVKAVKKRLMSEVPYGVMLSGGLDSSIIASIAAKLTRKMLKHELIVNQHLDWKSSENSDSSGSSGDEQMDNYWPRLHSFSIGLPDKLIRIDSFFEFQILNSFFTLRSPDLICAKEVADFLQTVHHEYHFTVQEGLDAISDVIHHLETYDVTTVRASTPMYLLSRKIKANSVKMVLSGEGSDEIFGGYLYFHSAPDKYSFHQETVERVRNLHTSDCLRANKSTMAWGLEARVPFLDKDFLDVIMSIDPSEKMCSANRIEKYILRKYEIIANYCSKEKKNLSILIVLLHFHRAFDTSNEPNKEPYLPEKILWRQKEQFSDGVGYSWIDSLKIEAEHRIPDDLFSNRTERWPEDTPQTKEAYWYREIFEMHFPQKACVKSVVRWIPRSDWGCPTDPSGRAQKIHQKSLYSQRERNFNEIQIA